VAKWSPRRDLQQAETIEKGYTLRGPSVGVTEDPTRFPFTDYSRANRGGRSWLPFSATDPPKHAPVSRVCAR
jgi:hypothetical protein